MSKEKCCGTCRFLAVLPDAAGRTVVRPRCVYQCTAIVSLSPLPDSVTHCYGYSQAIGRRLMCGDEGSTCPTYEARDTKKRSRSAAKEQP